MNRKAISQFPVSFPYQSYFDSTRLENALAVSKAGSIYAGNPKTVDTEGFGIALHPSSATPIVVQTFGDAESSPILVTPGTVHRFGAPFKKIEWGVPFGWYGGGLATLVVLHDKDADAGFPAAGPARMLFQRVRVPIDQTLQAVRQNWPGASPWPYAQAWNGTANVKQATSGIFEPEPDIVIMRVRAAPAAATTLSLVWRGVDDFDTGSDGTLGIVDQTIYDVPVPASTDGASFPLIWLPPEVHKLTCSGDDKGNCGGIAFLDPTGALNGQYVDCLRYFRVT